MSIIYGTSGNENISGTTGNDIIYGYEGNDTLSGDAGNDALYGSSGNDMLFGHGGNDTLYGGAGKNYFEGNDGDDLIVIDSAFGNKVLGGSGNDTLLINVDNYFTRYETYNIENIQYAPGVRILPYFIDNLLQPYEQLHFGDFGTSKTYTYSFANFKNPNSDTLTADFLKFDLTKKQATRNALKLYSDVAGITFIEKADGDTSSNIMFGSTELPYNIQDNWYITGVNTCHEYTTDHQT